MPNALGSVLFTHLPRMAGEDQNAMLEKSSRITFLLAVIIGTCVAAISKAMPGFRSRPSQSESASGSHPERLRLTLQEAE